MHRLSLISSFLLVLAAASHVSAATSGVRREQALTTCPNPDSIDPPPKGSFCDVAASTFCKYDKVCCCSSCVSRFACSCVNSAWQCSEVALDCLPGPCPATADPLPQTSPPTPRPTPPPTKKVWRLRSS